MACFLASELNKVGYALELFLIEGGALLHDIARIHSIETGDDHTSVGGTWLKERGFGRVAYIIRSLLETVSQFNFLKMRPNKINEL